MAILPSFKLEIFSAGWLLSKKMRGCGWRASACLRFSPFVHMESVFGPGTLSSVCLEHIVLAACLSLPSELPDTFAQNESLSHWFLHLSLACLMLFAQPCHIVKLRFSVSLEAFLTNAPFLQCYLSSLFKQLAQGLIDHYISAQFPCLLSCLIFASQLQAQLETSFSNLAFPFCHICLGWSGKLYLVSVTDPDLPTIWDWTVPTFDWIQSLVPHLLPTF